MIYIVINAAAIFTATCAALAFGAAYCRLVSDQRLPDRGTAIIVFIAEFWLCSILAGALILAPAKGSVWTMTLGSAFVIWVGFVAPVLVVTYRARRMRWRAALADMVHWLGAMLIMAVVLRLIGLSAPPV